MALLWIEGFESYNTAIDFMAVRNPLFTNVYCTGDLRVFFNTNYGRRTGTGGMLSTRQDWRIQYEFASNYVTIVTGFAIKLVESGTPVYASTAYGGIIFKDSTTVQCGLYPNGTEMQARNGDGTLLGTTSGLGLHYNSWVFVEIKVTIDNSGGVVVVRANNNVVLNLSSQDTQYSANAYLNRIEYCGIVGDLDTYYDDLYILDTTGTKNNDFLGDVRIDAVRPNGVGSHTDFTPLSGANYENVDETLGPDDNTSYNSSGSLGAKDSYAMSSLAALGTTIHGVKTQISASKDDAGARGVKCLTKAGSTEDTGTEMSLSQGTYETPAEMYEDNPDDSAAWEEADVNGMEVGVEIST